MTTEADCTVPNWLNAVRRSSDVVLNDRLPTYKFLLIVTLREPKAAHQPQKPPRAAAAYRRKVSEEAG
jgi:hypothetical protein